MVASRSHSGFAPARRSFFQRHPALESLEGRLLMAGLDVPQLSSRPGASATVYLDFDGHVQASWGSFSNITTPAYDRDNILTSFSATELTSINDIWTRVAEDFAPFNVNVTTVEPASFADGVALRVVIGGKWSDWYGTQANGVSFIGSFTDASPNVSYVFSKDIGGGFPKWVSERVSHEAGHAFGLQHQSSWSGSVLQAELNSGSGDWAPIMGTGNFAARSTWHNGATHDSPTSFQDDMAIIGGATNGFGYVADDYADSLATASELPISGNSVNLSGLIGQTGDQDVFKFTTAGGDLSFNLAVARVGANFDSVLELRDANGQVVTIVNDTASGVFSSTLAANVATGTYYLVVRSSGGYGNVGQYALTGTVVPGVVTAPEISVLVGGAELASGGSVSFGSTLVGTPVMRTFAVQNFGNGDLTLTPLDGSSLPSGFSLTANLGATALPPGQSTTFTLQLDATAAGTFGGTIHVLSDDADEGSFDLEIDGTVTAPVVTSPEIRMWSDDGELASGDTVDFGPTLLGADVTRTFTIQNVGNGELLLNQLSQSSLPAGFSLVQGLGATTLPPTDFTHFVVRFDASAAGTFGDTLQVVSNDADEGSFDVVLSGAVTAPEIRVFAGSMELASGDTLDFGSTVIGTPVTRTFTIQNVGDGDLDVSAVDAGSLPAGFTLVSSFGNTTVVPGASITFTLQLDAAAAGTFGGTIHVLSSDADEGSFSVALVGAVTAPEISVYVGGTELASGGTIDFGATTTGTPVTRTVTVRNVGDAGLVLAPIDPSTLPVGFSLVSNLDVTTLAPGESTTFTVQLDAAAAGSLSGVIHVLSGDADEGSFDLALTGEVNHPSPPPLPPPTPSFVKTIDNGAHGFTATGKWHVHKHKGGFDRDIQVADKAGNKDKKFATATWTFTGLETGQYRVSVSFPNLPSNASNAPCTVLDGAMSLGTMLVNQKSRLANHKKGRDESLNDDVQWQSLGTFTIQSGTLAVQLTNRANGKVVADAVRIELVTTVNDLLLSSPTGQRATANTAPAPSAVLQLDVNVVRPALPPPPLPAPAPPPLHLADIAAEQSLLDHSSALLDELAADLAQQYGLASV